MDTICGGQYICWKFPIQQKRLVDAVFTLHMCFQRLRGHVDIASLTLNTTTLPITPVEKTFPAIVVDLHRDGHPNPPWHRNHRFCFGCVDLQAYPIKHANQDVKRRLQEGWIP